MRQTSGALAVWSAIGAGSYDKGEKRLHRERVFFFVSTEIVYKLRLSGAFHLVEVIMTLKRSVLKLDNRDCNVGAVVGDPLEIGAQIGVDKPKFDGAMALLYP